VHIEAIAYELAPCVVSSEELEERLAPAYRELRIQPGQLQHLTGIAERRFWEPGYPVSRGAALAAAHVIRNSGISPALVGSLVYGGVCREHFEPATACHVAAALSGQGLRLPAWAELHDLGNACLGVMSGIVEVADRIELGRMRAGLVVACESAREIVDLAIDALCRAPSLEGFKTSLATLTGGSAAVAVLLGDGSLGGGRRRICGGVVQSAPEHHRLCRWGIEPAPASEHGPLFRQFARTDSSAVLEHGVALGSATWKVFLDELGWRVADVDRTICHQVGAGHRDVMLRTLGVAPERDFVAYEHLGNTGSVALPLAAALAEQRGVLWPGHRVGLLGIGSGLACAMLGVEW
jgi:3-oxoacyl-[acyl-carrier-protein] synthase-3